MILLFIFILPLCAYGFDSTSSTKWPSLTDYDEAFRLTSWISNETVNFILTEYLILCPEQDMCLGPMFKRNYTFTQQPACTPCECDDSCVRRSTCCPSKFYRQTDTPDFIEYQQNVFDSEEETPLSCKEPLWNPTGVRSGNNGYWMVDTCPDKLNCIAPPSKNISRNTPVTSLVTNQTYFNIYCALCNQEEMHHLLTWEEKKICIQRSALLSIEDMEALYQSVFSAFPICNIGFHPPTLIQNVVQSCIAYTHDVNCNVPVMRNNAMTFYLTKACKEYHLPFYSYEKLYKNIYCALCEVGINDLTIQNGGGGVFGDSVITPFTALMNFQQVEDSPITKNRRCTKENQIFDKRMNKCLDIQCEAEYIYQNSACSLIHKMLEEMNYEVNLVVTSADDISMEIYSPSVMESLQSVLQLYNFTDHLCRMSALLPSNSDDNFLAVVIELSIKHLHDIDQMIQYILDIFNSHRKLAVLADPHRGENYVSLALVGQSFHGHGGTLFEKNLWDRFYVNPMSGIEMRLYQSLNVVDYANFQQRPNCFRGDLMSVVADWYRCPKVKITTADARLNVSNFSVCLVDYDVCFASTYFKESLDKRSVAICLDQYLQTIEASNSNFRSSDNLMATLSLVFLSLSSLGSLATLFTLLVSGSYSRIADVNIIILALFICLANTAHTISSLFVWSHTLCIGIGMLVHFCWLSVVSWMSLSSFQTFQTFTSFSIANVKVTPRVLYCLGVNLIICSSLVAINVTLSYVTSNGDNLGYSIHTCYIAKSDMILFTFALPVGLLISINIFMFAVTVLRISSRTEIRKSKDKTKIVAYFRLSTITGATWLFGLLAQLTGLQIFDILHIVINGGQGVFLYLAFGISISKIKSISKSSQMSESTKVVELK